jgi:hypothetical protein
MKRPAFRAPRGGAAVELAVLMVLLIPLVMYTLYMEDLLFYKLDQEETVFSAPWDFAHHDYRHRLAVLIPGEVQRLTGQIYWDHTSAWNTYDNPRVDGNDTKHHQALTAHQCWLTQGAQELRCGWDSNGVGDGRETDSHFRGVAAGGRVAQCSAILGVQNYFLPEKFLGGLNNVAYSKRWTASAGGANIHDNAKHDNWVFPRETFAVLHDPWALNYIKQDNGWTNPGHDVSNLDPQRHAANRQSECYEWVNRPYTFALLYSGRMTPVTQFARAMVSDFLTARAYDRTADGIGDFLDTPAQAFLLEPTQAEGQFQPSGYADTREQSTHGARSNAYLGRQDSTW